VTVRNVCPSCSIAYPATQRFCTRDGARLQPLVRQERLSLGALVAGRYRISAQVGEGATSTVHLAIHVVTQRVCALKIIHPDLTTDPESMARFQREAANASRIRHPHVVAIHDFGETGDRQLFLAMEFVRGESLSELLAREDRVSTSEVTPIITAVAGALTAAHEIGIVHRDIKPDNILVGLGRERTTVVKVADFGLAKASHALEQRVTLSGALIGTPAYMSPEQANGEHLDARTDIYSMALVAFRMLTGQLPFAGATAEETIRARLLQQPRTLREARPNHRWPAGLQPVFDAALAANRNARTASAIAFARALEGELT
jgi:eukaryotic-like serine/threonine-protein kinase